MGTWLLLEGRADRAASQAVTAGLVSLLSLEIERRYTLDTVERRRRAQVFDRLARATVDDLAAGRLLTSIGLNDQDVCCAVIAEDDDAEGLAADLAATLPDALVRRVGDVVHVAVYPPAWTCVKPWAGSRPAGQRASASACAPAPSRSLSARPLRRLP